MTVIGDRAEVLGNWPGLFRGSGGGEQLYVDQIRPVERAQLLVNNEDPAAPTLTRR
ncbi:hypothetical protein [Kribbella shirazensis]|uniref:Uncharacterized protein n=1 Tax=Kribbella shirazensis TaxID=1105143 RepID=A0A7X5VAQ3_9ACTN|nr:hypothetical protein [Kribbella shirazensis]NIK57331.1 hypothetical protein [Kribbella shirazensis]